MSLPLETRELAIGYGRRGQDAVRLAQGLNLSLERGQMVGLMGANGIGKSTLLRTLAGMQKPLAGRALLAGDDIRALKPPQLARRLSMVLTNAPVPQLMTGYALVALGRQPHTNWLGMLSDADHRQARLALEAVKAEDLADMPVAQCSDGQRQKLFIARALAQECPVMLLDEPTAWLDLPRRLEIMALLKRLAHTQKRSILVSTHDLELALRNCDRLWLMDTHGIKTGAPEDLILNGGFKGLFDAHDISFDQDRGSFTVEANGGTAVHAQANGARGSWLRRALVRAGYAPDCAGGRIVISDYDDGRVQAWKLRIDQSVTRHDTIEGVLRELERQRQ